MFRRRQRRTSAEPGPWSRERLLVMLGGIVLAAAVLVAGVAMAIWYAVVDHNADAQQATEEVASQEELSARDRIAAEPMASAEPDAAFTPDAALSQAGTITIPVATEAGGPDEDGDYSAAETAMVPTGFPQTPQGAVGQLAAIEQAVLESMSLDLTRDIHAAWVQPGGPSFAEWELTRNVQAFLTSGHQSGSEKDLTTLVSATPAAGLVKGVDGPGWTVACVLMDIQVAIKAESRMGYGWCQRMEWIDHRWQIAAGPVPAQAPSTWPGSTAAAEAGWLTWIDEVES